MNDSRALWIALTLVPGLGPARIIRLVEQTGGVEAAWRATPRQMANAGIDRRTAEAFAAAQHRLDTTDQVRYADRTGVQIICWDSSGYPDRLREIGYPPPVLYVRGELLPEDADAVAIVGTRRATVYGRDIAGRFATALAERGISVVSGLAKGIDGVAHQAAIDAGGRTIAVLGSGVDRIYPPEHVPLARRIERNGAVLSLFELGRKPDASNFPLRNKIISGLSLGVLVVEAGEKSGALLTARDALDQNREVFAVPGSIMSGASRGTNALIQRGEAKLVSGVEDVLSELQIGLPGRQLALDLPAVDDPVERRLLEALREGALHVDDLRLALELPISSISTALTMLELKGQVRAVGGMQYALARAR